MNTYIFKEYGQDRIVIKDIIGSVELEGLRKLDSYHLIMIESGTLSVEVNCRRFNAGSHSSLHLQANDLIRNIISSKDISGYHIIFSADFQTEIRMTRKSPISVQLKREFPYQEFTDEEYDFLNMSVSRLIKYIEDDSHHYQSIVIKNEVHNLLLNISDKRRKDHGDTLKNPSHHEVIIERFRSLINGHCNEHHSVNWYADMMMISPDYLSKITRETDGRSARAWINERLIDNAKFIMKQSDLTLKEISEKLNFPDQSGFGRFFKANTGISPKEFRQRLCDQEES